DLNRQSMYYKYSKSYYNSRKWEAAEKMFQKFNSVYFTSPNREETMYLEAKSAYNLSEVFTLDQHITYEGIRKFETFITAYPESEHIDEANKNLRELKDKIERKAYESAKLYNQIGEYTRDYNAAIVALDNFLLDYPGTVYKTDALYYKFDSAYKLSLNSVPSKMEERLKNAISLYDDLISFDPNTKYKSDADQMLERLNKELQQFSRK
ncbi:MAG TPA: outer membrane protein assembly factor BamD, partial [Flavobacterium sp.]|nr:outer membrane protein assembly factor BamD [Flavobacterium sp.]